jgi:hypothetical protein
MPGTRPGCKPELLPQCLGLGTRRGSCRSLTYKSETMSFQRRTSGNGLLHPRMPMSHRDIVASAYFDGGRR